MARSILIADDHEEMRLLVVELLQAQGHQIRQASDTQTVLDEITRGRPDLLILDVNMPGEGGIAALQEIRRDHRLDEMRVLVLTGSVDLTQDWLAEIGADALLPKPFQIEEFNSTVERLLAG